MANVSKETRYLAFRQSWNKQNSSSIIPKQDKKRNSSLMNKLYAMLTMNDPNRGVNK